MITLPKIVYGIKFFLGLDIAGRNLVARTDDTFVVSYGKSGSTWVRFLIANLILYPRVVKLREADRLVPHCEGQTRRFFTYMPRPRIIATHTSFDPQIKKVIYIVRDPRDVVVSLYHFQRKRRRIADDYPMDLYVSRFLAGDTTPDYGSWAENVASWLATRYNTLGFLLLRYEDLLAETPRELAKIASFVDMPRTAEDLAQVALRASANRMRELERAGDQFGVMKNSRSGIPFVRSARAGGWKTSLQGSLAAEIERAWGPLMTRLGYELSGPLAPGKVRETSSCEIARPE
jgi:hypothetical protein